MQIGAGMTSKGNQPEVDFELTHYFKPLAFKARVGSCDEAAPMTLVPKMKNGMAIKANWIGTAGSDYSVSR